MTSTLQEMATTVALLVHAVLSAKSGHVQPAPAGYEKEYKALCVACAGTYAPTGKDRCGPDSPDGMSRSCFDLVLQACKDAIHGSVPVAFIQPRNACVFTCAVRLCLDSQTQHE